MTPADTELVARVLARDDRAAFGELVARHQAALRRYLAQLCGGNQAQADDLAQESFLAAYRSLGRYRGDARFSTWLFGIAHNLHRNQRRREETARENARGDGAEETSPSHARPVDLAHDLDQALEQLSEEEKTAVHLFYRQDLTQEEISAVAGWPLGTVKTHLARAKEKLRRLLRAWNPQT